MLAFPNRYLPFQFVDQPFGRLKCIITVRAANRDRDARLADIDSSQAMNYSDFVNWPMPARLLFEQL